MSKTKALYRFHASFGRMGDMDGLFLATDAQIKNVTGKHVHFGEVLGKHSDISLRIESKHFEKLTDDAAFVAKFAEYGCASGTNPVEIYADQEAENTEG